MKPLPKSDFALVIRTDFTSDEAWNEIKEIINTPVDGFYAYVHYVDDPEYDGITREQILELFRGRTNSYTMVVDRVAMTEPEHPVLVIDLYDDPHLQFRAIPSMVQSIENNLSIANMDFDEFANAVDEHGIFRGFPEF